MAWFPESIHCIDCGAPIYEGGTERCKSCVPAPAEIATTMNEAKDACVVDISRCPTLQEQLIAADALEPIPNETAATPSPPAGSGGLTPSAAAHMERLKSFLIQSGLPIRAAEVERDMTQMHDVGMRLNISFDLRH